MFSYFTLVAFVLAIFLNSALSINFSQFCAASDQICHGKYTPDGEYKTVCKIECESKHNYTCSDTFCGVGDESCAHMS